MVNNMDTSVMKIKCPNCGAVLAVKIVAGIEGKQLTCPVCKEKAPFTAFRPLDNIESEETQYPGEKKAKGRNEEETQVRLNNSCNYTLGQLNVIGSKGLAYRLKTGKNIIGRQASASTADIQIPTGGSRRLSREHLIIEIKKIPGKGFVHYVSLYKLQCNATFINDSKLEYGDCIILRHGDIIKLPDISIKFEIPDDEGTDI